MKRSKLIAIKEKMCSNSSKPWACFETSGPEADGKVAFSISSNKAFLKNLQQLGMAGQTDEETLQMFFLQMRMIPEGMMEEQDDVVNPEATPNLTNEANQFRRG